MSLCVVWLHNMGPYQALPGRSGVITYPNLITGKSAHLAGVVWQNSMRDCDRFFFVVPGRWGQSMRSQIPQEKNAKSHTEPPAFEWASWRFKSGTCVRRIGERPNLYIATFGKGIPPKSVDPPLGKSVDHWKKRSRGFWLGFCNSKIEGF